MLNQDEIIELRNYIKKHSLKGVEVRPSGLRLKLVHQGQTYRKSYDIIPTTSNALVVAADFRMLKLQIKQNVFQPSKFFNLSDAVISIERSLRVRDELDLWFSTLTDLKPMTYDKYKQYVEVVKAAFGKLKLTDITVSAVKQWEASLRTEGGEPYANATLNAYRIPLKGIFQAALEDRLIEYDPTSFLPALKRGRAKDHTCDPFSKDEIDKVLRTPSRQLNEINAFEFGVWTGLRPSELLGLAWEDVDFENNCFYVKRTMVYGNFGATKNDGSRRRVDLLKPAKDALMRQKLITYMYPAAKVEVLDDENKRKVGFDLKFVFFNSKTQEAFISTRPFNTFLRDHLAEAGVRYRSIKQIRHTYASQLLTAGVRERWIATQMGHATLAMLENHYAKFILDDMEDMVNQANKAMNFGQ